MERVGVDSGIGGSPRNGDGFDVVDIHRRRSFEFFSEVAFDVHVETRVDSKGRIRQGVHAQYRFVILDRLFVFAGIRRYVKLMSLMSLMRLTNDILEEHVDAVERRLHA